MQLLNSNINTSTFRKGYPIDCTCFITYTKVSILINKMQNYNSIYIGTGGYILNDSLTTQSKYCIFCEASYKVASYSTCIIIMIQFNILTGFS